MLIKRWLREFVLNYLENIVADEVVQTILTLVVDNIVYHLFVLEIYHTQRVFPLVSKKDRKKYEIAIIYPVHVLTMRYLFDESETQLLVIFQLIPDYFTEIQPQKHYFVLKISFPILLLPVSLLFKIPEKKKINKKLNKLKKKISIKILSPSYLLLKMSILISHIRLTIIFFFFFL